jgi:hypothetical protein
MEIWLTIPFAIAGILTMLSGVKNLTSYRQFKEVKRYIESNGLEPISTNNAYYSAVGLKKDYPSYPTKTFLTVTKNDLIIFGINSFPFIFKTYSIPFIVSIKPELLIEKLNANRIFKLDNISVKNKTIDFKFVDRNGIKTTIEYQMNFKHQIDNKMLDKLKSIEKQLKLNNEEPKSLTD